MPSNKPQPPLQTSFTVRASAGEPTSAVQIRNLHTTSQIGDDAWGRQRKTQPLQISVEVSLAQPFGTSDEVDPYTVHYGLLSKAVLSAVEGSAVAKAFAERGDGDGDVHVSLRAALDYVWSCLTHLNLDGSPNIPLRSKSGGPFLDVSKIRFLSVKLHLPKAALLGDGVSLTGSATFQSSPSGSTVEAYGLVLRLHCIRVPTLIGINTNEREAKQMVSADVDIDRLDDLADVHVGLHSIVAKVMSTSESGTLETLAANLSQSLKQQLTTVIGGPKASVCQITIALEKPIAVTLADTPRIVFRAP